MHLTASRASENDVGRAGFEARSRLDDWQALTITLFAEAGAEPVEGKIAVGNVIRP